MIRNNAVRLTVVTIACTTTIVSANRIITDTRNMLNTIRANVIKKAQEDQHTIRNTWSPLLNAGIGLAKFAHVYDKNTMKSAKIAFPFFKVRGAASCLNAIGSTQDDLDYFQSVFTEFYGSGERSMYRLVNILHNHMMAALGFNKSLDQFKHMMENTNHNGYPKGLNQKQFDIYCRCVARGLYAVYWFDHGYN